MPKAAIDHGPEPAPRCATGFTRGQTPRVSAPSALAVAWGAAQPDRAAPLLCATGSQWAVHGTMQQAAWAMRRWAAARESAHGLSSFSYFLNLIKSM
jgi:hypothetical protein